VTVAIGVLPDFLLVTLRHVFALGDHHVKTHSRVVVIGGGVVGVSTLYHLALKGWTDAVLLERAELTAGSTWHAAGLLPLFNMSYTVGQLH
jgi:dimethylglycine dehydrogenase